MFFTDCMGKVQCAPQVVTVSRPVLTFVFFVFLTPLTVMSVGFYDTRCYIVPVIYCSLYYIIAGLCETGFFSSICTWISLKEVDA